MVPLARYEVLAVSAGAVNIDSSVRRAVEVLRAGGLLAHPTETVYGIGGDGTASVDSRVAALKGRVLDRAPLLRIAHDEDALRRTLPDLRWPPAAGLLASRFWPGGLTMVLDDGSARGAAVRVEGHPVTRAVLEAWNAPITSTSLNRSGEAAAVTADDAARTLRGMPDPGVPILLLDAGDLPGPPPSTLVSLRGPVPKVLREGAVSGDAIRECLAGRNA